MILRYPTGLYRDVLPRKPADSGSVIYTISTTAPPRTDLVFPKIPRGLVERKRAPKAIPRTELRKQLGPLVFTVSKAARTLSGNNARQYSLGQVLTFEEQPKQLTTPMLVGQETELRHDTNTLDYTTLGLSVDEQQQIADNSLQTFTTLTVELNVAKRRRVDAEFQIATKQKIINEAGRAIEAVESIIGARTDPSLSAIITKLEASKAAAITARDAAVLEANASAAEAEDLVARLRAIAAVLG